MNIKFHYKYVFQSHSHFLIGFGNLKYNDPSHHKYTYICTVLLVGIYVVKWWHKMMWFCNWTGVLNLPQVGYAWLDNIFNLILSFNTLKNENTV